MWNVKSLLAAASFGMIGISQVHAQVIAWTGPNLGNWSVGANWAGGLVPSGAGAVARFDPFSGQAMLTGLVAPIGTIEMLDPSATLNIEPAGTLTLAGGSSVNNGLIVLNRLGSSSNAVIALAGPTAFTGSGEIRMRTSSDNAQITGPGTLTNGTTHTLRGVGQIFAPIINNGLVAADDAVSVSGVDLELHGNVTNNSVLASADTGSSLEIMGGVTVTQTPTAQIIAQGGNVTFFGNSTVVGGNITDTGAAGRVFTGGGVVTLNSVDHSGTLTTVQPGGAVSIIGAGIVNDGVIQLNPAGSSSNSVMVFDQSGLLTGSGELRMRTFLENSQLNTAAGQSITHTAGHTIRGVGEINASLSNAGIIAADVGVSVSGTTLELQTNNKTNTGMLVANAGSVMTIESIAIDQTAGGMIIAQDGGAVSFFGPATILGGTITGGATGAVNVQLSSVATLDGVTLDAPFTIQPGGTVSVIGAGIVNDGVIQLNPSGSSSNAVMVFDQSGVLTGTGELHMRTLSDNSQLNTAAGQSITHTAGHTIRGVGELNAAINNAGIIAADVGVSVSGNTLELQTNNKSNSGMLMASPGSIMTIESIAIDQTAGGVIHADDSGSVSFFGPATILGGAITGGATGAVNVQLSSVATLDGVTLDAPFTIQPGGTVSVIGAGIVNDGVIQLNPSGSSSDSVLTLNNTTIGGAGEIRMRTFNDNSRITTPSGATGIIGPDQTIRGVGQIAAALTNNGTINADVAVSVSGNTLEILSEDITNNAQIGSLAGSSLFITGVTVDQTAGGSLSADAGIITVRSGTSIVGGTLGSSNGGSWATNGAVSVNSTTLTGAGTVAAASTLTVLGATLANNAAIVVNPTFSSSDGVILLTESTTLAGQGTITLVAGGADARISPAAMVSPTLTNGAGHTLAGLGLVQMPIINAGTLRPGTPVGVMSASGAVTLDPGGQFVATIAGNNSNGRLSASGPVTLAGTLDIQLAPAAALANGNNHIIVSAPSITGQFDIINQLISGQLITRVIYEPTQVVLRTRCLADVNLDASVTPADFSAWIAAFNAMNPTADQNLDGLVTPSDFSSWIQNFNTPCP